MLVRIANLEDPDQTASLDLVCSVGLRPLWQATFLNNFRISTHNGMIPKIKCSK